MLTILKSLLEDRCPVCSNRLQVMSNSACCTKSCPQGHYKEENYCTLGVTIIYDRLEISEHA